MSGVAWVPHEVRLPVLQSMSLAIDGLQPEFQRLRKGGVYWVACHRSGDAQALCCQMLAGLAPQATCALVSAGLAVEPMLAAFDSGATGSGQLRTFLLPPADVVRALPVFDDEIGRAWRNGWPELAILLTPVSAPGALDDAALRAVLARLHAGACGQGGRLLWITYGESATLAPRVLPFCDLLSGFARIYPDQGALRHHLHYWATESGVQAAREFVLAETSTGWRVEPASVRLPFTDDAGDVFLELAQGEVLEGAPALSPDWRVFPDWSALVAAAMTAQAASVMFAIHGNSQVDELAESLYALRRRRGAALGLVVREMAPCLRYADERLLLGCGANLIVPHGAPLARFLTLVESTRGNLWQGHLPDDPAGLIRAYRPPAVSGVVAPARFRQVVAGIEADTLGSGLENAALVLQPMRGVRADQALSQCQMRRQGDLACIHDGRVYLFLFACRRDGIEKALDNLFRLPWREMFSGYGRVDAHDLADLRDEGVMPFPSRRVAASAERPDVAAQAMPPLRRLRLRTGSEVP